MDISISAGDMALEHAWIYHISISSRHLQTYYSVIYRAGDVAQLVERQTGTPLTQVQVLDAARDFFSPSQLSAQALLRVSVHSRMPSHALISVSTLKVT